jgi:hypothetical protein
MMRGRADSVNAIALQQAKDSSRTIKGMGQGKLDENPKKIQEKKPGS